MAMLIEIFEILQRMSPRFLHLCGGISRRLRPERHTTSRHTAAENRVKNGAGATCARSFSLTLPESAAHGNIDYKFKR